MKKKRDDTVSWERNWKLPLAEIELNNFKWLYWAEAVVKLAAWIYGVNDPEAFKSIVKKAQSSLN